MRTRKNYIHMKKHTTHLYVGQRVTPRPSPSVTGQPPISGKPFFHPTFLASLTLVGGDMGGRVMSHSAAKGEEVWAEGEKSGKKFLLSLSRPRSRPTDFCQRRARPRTQPPISPLPAAHLFSTPVSEKEGGREKSHS